MDSRQPTMSLAGKRILLGITGGIAAYKTPELVRQLRAAAADVQVVLSQGGTHFVTATTLQAVSDREVRTTLWDPSAEAAMGHIELARWADAVLVAPATAHMLTKLAHGAADDLLTTICLATAAPIAVAPAMNQQMWRSAAVQRNLQQLHDDGVAVWGPGEGDQACGDVGPGRMLEPAQLVAALDGLFMPPLLAGLRVVITAGPTREPIDPVRFISNESSGKQGFAIAAIARAAGADVTLITGPVALPAPAGVTRVDVTTAAQMHEAVQQRVADADIFIGVAAVADYHVLTPGQTKIKKRGDNEPLVLELAQNPDIIAAVAARRPAPFTVGFAAETDNGPEHARAKLVRKGLDLIVLNDVSDPTIGFNSDDNAVTLIDVDGAEVLPRMTKAAVARTLIERVARCVQARSKAERGA
jgi:phosphopantothenoylcysteine decarboxylase / phosphopantothenate---cysteine ligase